MSKAKNSKYPPPGIWYWVWAVWGFFKTIYICIYWHAFYPKVAAINRVKLLEKYKQETKLVNTTTWDFIKFLFFDIDNLVGTSFEPFNPGRIKVGQVAPAAKKYGDRANFLTVYIAEAHPSDGWALDLSNDSIGVCYRAPRKVEDRIYIAKEFIKNYNYPVPLYVDSITDDTLKTYSSMPERLYIIKDGKVAYKGGPGPYCYSLEEMEEHLQKLF
ncbi:Type I iodothyronine deiodinase [Trichoplax sp. H2]|nr:Type I iodothyronine deiodinase [Trichoplax sp. H2]|eukprot:RDD42456.1 Type I iodothyronine deiodinase [Trichoplax sp. H2]